MKKLKGVVAALVVAGAMSAAFAEDAANSGRANANLPVLGKVSAEAGPTAGATWSAAPDVLFDGKTNWRFRPLVGPQSGAVALQFRGPKRMVSISIEYWQNGAKTKMLGGLSTTLTDKDKRGNYSFDGDFVYSLQDRFDSNGTKYKALVYAIASAGSSASTTFKIDPPAGFNTTGQIQLLQQISVPLNESAPVWGLQATDQREMGFYSSIPETLRSTKWAIVVRVGFTDKSNGQ